MRQRNPNYWPLAAVMIALIFGAVALTIAGHGAVVGTVIMVAFFLAMAS